MGKRPRSDEPGAWHHVANRGARRQQTFHNAADCRLFLYLLAEAHRRYEVETHAFCLMGNHYHLLVHSPRGNLAAAMQMVGTNYSRRFNRRHGFDGPLFKAVYWSNRITTDSYLLEASRYIHQNPKDLGSAVEPTCYPWSSLRLYADSSSTPTFVSTDLITRLAGGTERYLAFVSSNPDQRQSPYETDVAQPTGLAMWTPGRLIVPTAGPTEIHLSDIDQLVATLANVPTEIVRHGGRGKKNLGRLVAIKAAYELTGAPTEAISRHYNFPTVTAMKAMLHRSVAMTTEASFVELHGSVMSALN